ncbi:hypothetical protein Tsubulata_032827 [Turnera subulata]|uniref:TF-B3 domain-containing protein n=1 Tax=Turnera subulata TaxID=218843 RepID=A0A9Q0J5F2_9ROSI|nr:hypothetical protein Tsubulata_032827 [Turnera subulata]
MATRLEGILDGKERSFEEFCELCKVASCGDEEKAMCLLAEHILEGFIWFKIGQAKREYHKDKTSLDDQFLGVFMPKGKRSQRKRGSRTVSEEKLATSDDHGQVGGEKEVQEEAGEEEEVVCKPKKLKKSKNSGEGSPTTPDLETQKTKKIPRKLDLAKLGFDPEPDYSHEIRERIMAEGDTDLRLVLNKQLHKTDISSHHNRFSMPAGQIIDYHSFLTQEERRKIFEDKESLPVKLVDPGKNFGMVSEVKMNKWPSHKMDSGYSLVFTSNWNAVVRRNEDLLKPDSLLQVYSFRRGGQLWFVLKMLRVPGLDDKTLMMITSSGEHGGCGSSSSSGREGIITSTVEAASAAV